MTYRRLPPRPPKPTAVVSRREALVLLGALGGIGAITLCGGIAGVGVLLAQKKTPTPMPTADMLIQVNTPEPSPTATDSYPQPPILSRSDWGAQAPNHTATYENGFYSADNVEGWYVYAGDYRQQFQTLVVHHSVIYAQDDDQTVRDVQTLHMTERGWADIGYHFLVGKTGTLYEGRALNVRGTHTAGYNTGSIGVCLLGNTSVDGIPDAQWQALGQLCFWLIATTSIQYVAGHRDFNPQTECPGNTMYVALDQLADAIGLIRGTEGYIVPTTSALPMACGCCVTAL